MSIKATFRFLSAVLLILFGHVAGVFGDDSEVPFAEGLRIDIEDTQTRIGIAAVRLEISTLTIKESRVLGEYKIRVPLLKSKNDDGLIDLGFQQDLPTTFKKGGTLKGGGISRVFKNDPPRIITCEISPDATTTGSGAIFLTIETTDRTIKFRSRYRVLEAETKTEEKES